MCRSHLGWLGILIMTLTACGGRMPEDLGIRNGRLQACPDSPNCVSSFEADDVHGIPPIRIKGSASAAWTALEEELDRLPRVEVVRREASYIYAVYESGIMRYRDDVEFTLNETASAIEVRSASRVGYGDMGANRDRIESMRAALIKRGHAWAAGD